MGARIDGWGTRPPLLCDCAYQPPTGDGGDGPRKRQRNPVAQPVTAPNPSHPGSGSRSRRDPPLASGLCQESILISSDSECDEARMESASCSVDGRRSPDRGVPLEASRPQAADGGGEAEIERSSKEKLPPEPPPIPHGFSRCPVCEITIPSQLIHSHFEICIQRQEQRGGGASTSGRRPQPAAPKGAAVPAALGHTNSPYPLGHTTASEIWIPPKLVFEVISSKDLKTKMVALGLPVDGKKQVQ